MAALRVQSGKGGTQRTKDGRALSGAKAARDLVTHLHHAHIVFCVSVHQGNGHVGQEVHDDILTRLEASQKSEWFTCLDGSPRAGALGRRGGGGQADLDQFPGAASRRLVIWFGEMGKRRGNSLVRVQRTASSEHSHVSSPVLLVVFVSRDQITQRMRSAQRMGAWRGERRFQGTMNGDPSRARHDPHGLGRQEAPRGMSQIPGEPGRTSHMPGLFNLPVLHRKIVEK